MPAPIGYVNDAQFNEFVRFASQEDVSGQTTLESSQGSGVLSIKAKSKKDFIGNIGRSGESKAVNKNVRDLFMNSVLKMFGASKLEDLPDVVKAAMKPEDFKAQGKPLTARRVLAVQSAVRQNEIEMLVGAEMGIDVGADKKLRDRIHAAVEACGGNEDVFSVFQENYREILFEEKGGHLSDGPVLREDKAVRSWIKDLAPAIEWLREEIKDQQADPEFFDAAKPFLIRNLQDPEMKKKIGFYLKEAKSHNSSLRPGHLGAIKNLASSASAQDIHTAAAQLNQLLFRASGRSKYLMVPRGDYDEQLFANLVLARAFPNKADLRKLQAVLHSETASKLAKYYRDRTRDSLADVHANALATDLVSRKGYLYLHYGLALDQLRKAVDQLCDGISSADRPIKLFDGYVEPEFAPTIQREVEDEAFLTRKEGINFDRMH